MPLLALAARGANLFEAVAHAGDLVTRRVRRARRIRKFLRGHAGHEEGGLDAKLVEQFEDVPDPAPRAVFDLPEAVGVGTLARPQRRAFARLMLEREHDRQPHT